MNAYVQDLTEHEVPDIITCTMNLRQKTAFDDISFVSFSLNIPIMENGNFTKLQCSHIFSTG